MNQTSRQTLAKQQDPEAVSVGQAVVDTSLLYQDLRREYLSAGEPVEVDFRSLVGWVRVGDQLSHQIHTYPAKLLPHIAHFFARASSLVAPNSAVLDPFCGSGTVALEASLAGKRPLVADANPFALLLSLVKTEPYDGQTLRSTCAALIGRARRYRTAPEVDIVNAKLWYAPAHKRALEIILRAVLEVEDERSRNFFKVCFSAVARRLSFADPAISVPVRMRTKPHFASSANRKIATRLSWVRKAVPLEEFARTVESNIQRVEAANASHPDRQAAIVVGSDVRRLVNPSSSSQRLRTGSVPLVITSPPYGSAQKYIRASSLSLNWLGLATPGELARLEGRSIGREHLPRHLESDIEAQPLSKKFELVLSRIERSNPLRAQITRRYLEEMSCAVEEIARVVANKGHAVFVVGNNQVCGEVLRTDEFIVECFERRGLTLELSLIDHIKSRGLMTKRNKTASVISREAVLVFRKG